jgi:hypothetical protein
VLADGIDPDTFSILPGVRGPISADHRGRVLVTIVEILYDGEANQVSCGG